MTQQSKPSVTVLIAVHNGLRFLPEAVESILSQTVSDFEVIAIDDGSVDGSGDWLAMQALQEPRIRLLRQSNLGLTKSLNEGLRLARGEFIARMDADDIAQPQRLEKQLSYLKVHPEVVAIGSDVVYIDEKNTPMFRRRMPSTHEDICQLHLSSWGGWIIHPSAMIRSSALKEIGGYDEKFPKAQDYDLWTRLARIGRIENLPEVLLLYRFHGDAITQASTYEQSVCRQLVLQRELREASLGQPIELPGQFAINPGCPEWLIRAAARDGFAITCIKNSFRLFRRSCRNVLWCVYYPIIALIRKMPRL